MKCKCGIYCKGNVCLCGAILYEVKARVKKPIAKVSKKMATELNEYNKLRKQFLIENPRCAVFPLLRANQIHHKAGRIGPMLLDTSHWLAVSAQGHHKIETEPGWAVLNGFSELRLRNHEQD